MVSSDDFKVGDVVVFLGDSENFELNKKYTIYKFSKIDYFVDEVDPNFGKDCVFFENHKYGCFVSELKRQFLKINDIRENKLNDLF